MKLFVVSTLLLAASCSASLYGAVSTQYLSQDGHGQYSYGYSDPNSQKHETKTGDIVHGGYSYVDGHGILQSVKYSSDPVHGFQVAATNLPKGPAPAPAHAIIPAHYAPAPVSYIAPISYHAAPVSYASTYSAPLHYSYGPAVHGLPQPVQDTPEVAAAKIAHFAAHAQAKANLHHLHKRSASWGYAPSSWSHAAAPAIHNGVPVETPEVQQAKAAHFAAHAAANHGSAYAPAHYAPAPAHYSAPVIHNGVPVDTPEVQHAKAAHFAAVAEAQARSHSAPSHYEPAQYAPAHHGGAYHIPVIHNGVPVETPEVQHAKAAHFAAVAEAQSRSGYGHGHESYDNSWDNDGHNSWDNSHRDW
ncbi:Pupal cuticle protein Edg-84A [Pseudolycoriella hygida]|uniref:Pupal cuticle protein Edg-84A n=1 Tax=Pseudolycoriella hygida TaxID=35572 RepID=A0A9Q0RZD2_9DIPT|nr:Pupal cuticle protein Edg-84A [Pseudolycoriella hygida]